MLSEFYFLREGFLDSSKLGQVRCDILKFFLGKNGELI